MATLLQGGSVVGRFTVQNLSVGGALLTGAHDVAADLPLRLLLELSDGDPLEMSATVLRRAEAGSLVALAVAFRSISAADEDRIQDAILSSLDRRHRRAHPAVIVVDADELVRNQLVQLVSDAGLRPVACAAPLEALRTLEDPEDRVLAVVVRDRDDDESGRTLLSWLSEAHPAVRPVLVVEDRKSDPRVTVGIHRCHPEQLSEELRPPA